MHGVVFDSRIESAGKAVFAKVLAGEYAEGLVEAVAFMGPQQPQVGDGVDAALVVLEGSHEVLFAQFHRLQQALSFLPVFGDVAEDGLRVVLYHVLRFCLLLPTLLLFEVVAVTSFRGRAVDLTVEFGLFLQALEGGDGVALLNDLDWALPGGGFIGVGAGAELFEVVKLPIA
jgi:hypothetical protein